MQSKLNKPILLNLADTIYTERLVLRIPQPGDGVALNVTIRDSFTELHRWLMWCGEQPDVDATEAACRQSRVNFLARARDFSFLIFLKDGGAPIGEATFPKIIWSVPWVEIGYWIGSRYTNKGYATEVTRAMIGYAFEQIGAVRVEIHMDAGNLGSERVALKVGCQFEGLMRRDNVDREGRYRDTKVYSILKPLPELQDDFSLTVEHKNPPDLQPVE